MSMMIELYAKTLTSADEHAIADVVRTARGAITHRDLTYAQIVLTIEFEKDGEAQLAGTMLAQHGFHVEGPQSY